MNLSFTISPAGCLIHDNDVFLSVLTRDNS